MCFITPYPLKRPPTGWGLNSVIKYNYYLASRLGVRGLAPVSRLEYILVMAEDPMDILGGSEVKALPAPKPVGKPSKEQVFAEAYVRNGRDGAAAVRKAGLQDPRYPMSYVVQGLLDRPDVQAWVADAEAMVPVNRDVSQYTREFFLHELQEVHERSMEANQFASAISATKLQAQLTGMLEQTVNINHVMTPRELSLNDLRAMVGRALGDEAIPASGRVIEGE